MRNCDLGLPCLCGKGDAEEAQAQHRFAPAVQAEPGARNGLLSVGNAGVSDGPRDDMVVMARQVASIPNLPASRGRVAKNSSSHSLQDIRGSLVPLSRNSPEALSALDSAPRLSPHLPGARSGSLTG